MKITIPPIKLPQLSKKEWIIVGIGGGIIILGGLSATVYAYIQHRDTITACEGNTCKESENTGGTAKQTPTQTPVPTPKQVASLLNGALVNEGSEALRPLAVMIENHPEARPQSGLSKADIVYEALAEGGITRFMAVFGDPRKPVRVGPVRSARPYFVDFATEYKAFYAHVGGNANALDQIKATGVYDLDQFGLGEPTYKRDFSRNVATEHTMYSSTEKLWEAATIKRGWGVNAEYDSLSFKAEIPTNPAQTQQATVNFSTPSFLVDWRYNPVSNTYFRDLGGKPHLDAIDSKQIEATTVIFQTVTRTPLVTRINEKGWLMQLTGSGKATIIRNGTTVNATWKKSGTGRTKYFDEANQEITFNPGVMWITMVHNDTPVTIK